MALYFHRQAANVDGVHVLGQALLGLQNESVRVPLEGPAPNIVFADLERQVIGDKDQPARQGRCRMVSAKGVAGRPSAFGELT